MSKIRSWDDPIDLLFYRKNKTISTLNDLGYFYLKDLLTIIPLRIDILPPPQSFALAREGELFQGIGKIINIQKKFNFRRGKGKTTLYNLTVYLEDHFTSGKVLQINFFNCYPSIIKKLEGTNYIIFNGRINSYRGTMQINNPSFEVFSLNDNSISNQSQITITYPTIGGIKPSYIAKCFNNIPIHLWEEIEDIIPPSILKKNNLMPLNQCYQIIHGIIPIKEQKEFTSAKERLIYNDFFFEQLKIFVRRQLMTEIKIKPLQITDKMLEKAKNLFPYSLTEDQNKCLATIKNDLLKDTPMMRLIQGDVGSGKTTVAIIAALLVINNGQQSALMCPTESLAQQHFLTIKKLLNPLGINIELLTGGQKESEKKSIRQQLHSGDIQFIVGTHSLIQDSVQFNHLGLAIIDEQHKFGVNQRIKLTQKGEGVHTLIMTATPIPRSLSLTQYGDLDISIIKSMPQNRKGIKTRIVTPQTFDKFLSFILTRIQLGEQAYIVTPAIFEQEEQNFITLEKAYQRFTNFFPQLKIAALHGKLKSEEKQQLLQKFTQQEINILISTSVIEVGIDVPNATIMAILSPERFGLSSLHQLRGRVGRGNKMGFCFLVTEKPLAKESMERLMIIEQSTDGFYIAERDLELRGEGNLFGVDQSGEQHQRLGNIITHPKLLELARQDFFDLIKEQNRPILDKISQLMHDEHIIKTI